MVGKTAIFGEVGVKILFALLTVGFRVMPTDAESLHIEDRDSDLALDSVGRDGRRGTTIESLQLLAIG